MQGVGPAIFNLGNVFKALGRLKDDIFIAKSILAKHDENYMPPEVIESLSEHTSDPL